MDWPSKLRQGPISSPEFSVIPRACALVAFIVGASTVAAFSKPEKKFAQLTDGPVWSFDLASTGCQRAWGDPNSSAATNEITFAGDDTVAMAYATMVRAPSEKNWDYQACMFTIDARSGTQISQIRLDERRPVTSLYQPIVAETSDGKIRLTLDEFSTVYGRGLEVAAARQPITPSKEHWTGAHWTMFRAERDGTLWYDGSSEAKLLGKYTPDATFIYPLGPERVLVIAGKRFALFRGDGTQVKNESFSREGVHFAAVSSDHRKFAVSVYLWGVGDPSYLEEERIVVYDAENGSVVTSVPSNPLPKTQSWTALSPDGSLLAVGAGTTLRLFRLPSIAQSQSK